MSKRINVNAGQYKVAGRERMGENMTQSQQKEGFARTKAQLERDSARPAASARRRKDRKAPR